MNKEYLETAILAAQQGGKILQDYFDKVHDARQKNENARDIVTEVDILAEKTICETIAAAFPDHEIIGEETQSSPQGNRNRWFIDPIDGTVNYSQGIGICVVSVALEQDGELTAGVMFNPFTEELFYATRGGGAFLNGRKIEVSTKTAVHDALLVAAFSSARGDKKKKEYELFGKLNDSSRGVLRLGSAALALAYLACGRVDGVWAIDLFPWDLAAGLLLVREAGGSAVNPAGEPFRFGDNYCIATNHGIEAQLATVIREYA